MTISTIEDVRAHLLGALADLRDKDKPMDPDRARAIAQVAGVIVDTARVEVDFIKATGTATGTGFIPQQDPKPAIGTEKQGVLGVVTHRMKG